MNKKFPKLLKNLLKIDLLLAIFFMIVPFILPLTSGVLLTSISAYAYAKNSQVFLTILVLIGYLIVTDGIMVKDRRYNIILGLLLVSVVVFPVGEFRMFHDMVAILFFIGNTIVITYHSSVVSKRRKVIAFITITITVGLFLFGFITLFFAEALGFLLMSGFMFIRFIKNWKK